jgi:hypothetical protein
LQYFFISLFDSFGLLACCAAMQSFICCLCDLLCVLPVALLEGDEPDEDGVLLRGCVERSGD